MILIRSMDVSNYSNNNRMINGSSILVGIRSVSKSIHRTIWRNDTWSIFKDTCDRRCQICYRQFTLYIIYCHTDTGIDYRIIKTNIICFKSSIWAYFHSSNIIFFSYIFVCNICIFYRCTKR